MNLKSWVSLSKRESSTKQKTNKEAAVFFSSIVLAVLFGVLPLPVIWKWAGWLLSFSLIIYIIQTVTDPLNRLPSKTRWLCTILLCLIFIVAVRNPFLHQLRAERASVEEGDLFGAGNVFTDGQTHGVPMVKIGRTTFVFAPNVPATVFPLFHDSGVKIEIGKSGPLLSTVIRDRNGNLVAEVNQNHWRIYTQYSIDKNFTEKAIEIKDSAGHVVLQAQILLPYTIQLQGEWWDTQGRGIRMVNSADPRYGGFVVPIGRENQHTDTLIEPMFQYPSKDHLGELKQ